MKAEQNKSGISDRKGRRAVRGLVAGALSFSAVGATMAGIWWLVMGVLGKPQPDWFDVAALTSRLAASGVLMGLLMGLLPQNAELAGMIGLTMPFTNMYMRDPCFGIFAVDLMTLMPVAICSCILGQMLGRFLVKKIAPHYVNPVVPQLRVIG